MSNQQIAIHKHGEEGGLHIDLDGKITTPTDERPLWAEGYATANMDEYKRWFQQRLGQDLPKDIGQPVILETSLLSWIGVDEEGDAVEIEASTETRQSLLASHLGIDTSADNWEQTLDNQVASAMVDHDYSTHQTDETTLSEAEGESFTEAERKSAEG